MAGGEKEVVELDEPIEGEYDGTADLLFFRIGASVPLKPSGSGFDIRDPPKRPLAVSERFRVLFVAHTEGFLVVKTKDVIGLAKDIKGIVDAEKEKGVKEKGKRPRPTIQESSVLDVRIGKVSILALSMDSTTLAATVGGEVHGFSVASLLKKDQTPLFCCSLGESGSVKDLQWCKNPDRSFVVLSCSGFLFSGNMDGHLQNIMDSVDAVDWSVEGNMLAVAKNNNLSILSANFEEQILMPLLFESLTDGADSSCYIKVDSIRWVHSNNIIVGCIQANGDGVEEGYMVLIVSSTKCGFKASSKPMVVSFSDLFHGIGDDLTGEGPHLFATYLDGWNLAIVANRKNTDDHVGLLELPADDMRKESVALELEQEKYTPRIELQENGDDNLILGLDIDKISLYERLELVDGEEVKELMPCCILLCLTSEGRLIMFHVARISDPPAPLKSSFEVPEVSTVSEVKSSAALTSLSDPSEVAISEVKASEQVDTGSESKQITGAPAFNTVADEGLKNFGNVLVSESESSADVTQNTEETSISSSSAMPFVPGQVAGPEGLPQKQGFDLSFRNSTKLVTQTKLSSFGNNFKSKVPSINCTPSGSTEMRLSSNKGFTKPTEASPGSIRSQADSSGSAYHVKPLFSDSNNAKFPSFTSSSSLSTLGGSQEHVEFQNHYSNSQSSAANISFVSNTSISKGSTISIPQSEGHKYATGKGVNDLASKFASGKEVSVHGKSSSVHRQPTPSDYRTFRSAERLKSDSEIPMHFYSLNDMVRELDELLLGIEKEGDFADACTLYLNNSVSMLEKNLLNFSERSRICKSAVVELVAEVQHLQDKMVQVSAREGYMEGIVKQASNTQYWDIWNRQKLGPEFELKQQLILKMNQNLRNQLVELERHFNVLELNQFGERGKTIKGRRLPSTSESSRRMQSLHRLYNTVTSQLTAAEHLSECLSGQMAVLKIASPPMKKQSVAKVLESIGIVHRDKSYESPDTKGVCLSPDSYIKIPFSLSSSGKVKNVARRNASSALKSVEPETARRRRDSLDRNLASFEPQKTTVKRVLQQDVYRLGSIKSSKATKESFGSHGVAGFASMQQKPNERDSSLSFEKSSNKSPFQKLLPSKDFQEELSKQSSQPQTSSLFKWASDIPGPSRFVEAQSLRAPDAHLLPTTGFRPPSSISTPPTTSRVENRTETSASSYMSSEAVCSVVLGTPTKVLNSIPPKENLPLETAGTSPQTSKPGNKTGRNVSASFSINLRSGQNSSQNLGRTLPSPSAGGNGYSLRDDAQGSQGHAIGTSVITQASPVLPTLSSAAPIKTPSPASTVGSGGLLSVSKSQSGTDNTFQIAVPSSSSVPSSPFSFLSPNSQASTVASSISATVSQAPSSLATPSAFGGLSNVSKSRIDTNEVPKTPPSSSVSSSPFSFPSQNSQASSNQVSKTTVSSSSVSSSLFTFPSQSPQASSLFSSSANAASQTRPSLATAISSTSELNNSTGSATNNSATLPSDSQFISSIHAFPSASNSESSSSSSATPASTSLISGASSQSASSSPSLFSTIPVKEKDDGLNLGDTQEDMEEEAPETSAVLNLSALGGFGFGSSSASTAPKSNPFGGSFGTISTSPTSSPFLLTTTTGQLFKPASFSLPSMQPPSQPMNPSGASGGFSGFGQPAQIGVGQQALGSVLGAFGQSRQLGTAQGVGLASGGFGSSGFAAGANAGKAFTPTGGFAGASVGGFAGASVPSSGGFASAATGGGFAAVVPSGSGFAGVSGGGFAAVGSNIGGIGGAASAGASFGGVASGGFGSAAGAGKPPVELLMQMRK